MAAGIVGTEDAVERTRMLGRGWMRCAAREYERRWGMPAASTDAETLLLGPARHVKVAAVAVG